MRYLYFMFALDLKLVQNIKKRKYEFPVKSIYFEIILKSGLSIKAKNLKEILSQT